MQVNILWTGREYYSLENCLVKSFETGSEIESTIVGKYKEKIYKITYKIRTNQDWETTFLEIYCQHNNQITQLQLEGDGNGNWKMNGNQAVQFNGCTDVDIPLTPFTNTLPINRLRLKQGEESEINVIYLDLLAQRIIPVTQKYVCLSKTKYHYENVPNDFEADIDVDGQGFVVDYPLLFKRSSRLESDY